MDDDEGIHKLLGPLPVDPERVEANDVTAENGVPEQVGSAWEVLDAGAQLRRARRLGRLSQRELATRSGVPLSTVTRIESGERANPGVRTMARLVGACGFRIEVVADDGRAIARHPHEDEHDHGGRHFPAHVELVAVPKFAHEPAPIDWWGWQRTARAWRPGAPIPRYTFSRSRGPYYRPRLDPVTGDPVETESVLTWENTHRRSTQALAELNRRLRAEYRLLGQALLDQLREDYRRRGRD